MSSAITKRIVLTAEPRDRPYELRGAQVHGLIFRVQPSGHKAWIVTWAHGKRRTLGSVEHLSLDQARDQARQASKPTGCTLETLLNDHFERWAIAELKGGRQYPDRIQSVFPWLLRRQIIEIDVPTMERWWRGRVTGPGVVTKATAARDVACLRSALSRAVEWKLIETSPLMGMRQPSAASRKVVWFLPLTKKWCSGLCWQRDLAVKARHERHRAANCLSLFAHAIGQLQGDPPARLSAHPLVLTASYTYW
ncbi:hypothetical protein G6F57_017506 [Rhizopus arrhizus]|nr:hypothetical protein G6F57_017506 [Rhizopus arrhizus]